MTSIHKHEMIYHYLDQPTDLALIEEERVAQALERQHFHIRDRKETEASMEARKFAAVNHASNLREKIKKLGEEPCA